MLQRCEIGIREEWQIQKPQQEGNIRGYREYNAISHDGQIKDLSQDISAAAFEVHSMIDLGHSGGIPLLQSAGHLCIAVTSLSRGSRTHCRMWLQNCLRELDMVLIELH